MRFSVSFHALVALGIAATSYAAPTATTIRPDSIIKRGDDDWLSPVYTPIFQKPLVLPKLIQPLTSYTNETTGETFDFYEIKIQDFTTQVYPNLPATAVQGYNAQIPGPLFRVTAGGPRSVVRFINQVANPASIHLHGSPSRPPFDGWAEDTIENGQYKDYVYPNEAGRTLWYHDHAIGKTAINAFMGQAGCYFVTDPVQEAQFDLPQGEYDIPLVIADKIYKSDGQLQTPAGETRNYFGDIIHVNGVPWPFLDVEPRKYRFRILDASTSRSYKLTVESTAGTKLPMIVVATDSGFAESSVSTDTLIIAIAERYEFIVDFSNFAGQNVTMKNARDFSRNEDYANTDKVMQFNVGTTVSSQAGNGPVPSALVDLDFPPPKTTVDHQFKFERTNGEWRINDIGFEDVTNRVLATPKQGEVEVWDLINGSGGWAHPIHIHLIDFRVVSRNGRGVEPYEIGFKDTVFLDENEEVQVIARFHPWAGEYMFHCHNLIHEDHDMMAEFDVNNTRAEPTKGDKFSNPVNPTFRAKAWTSTDMLQVQSEVLPFFATQDIYPL
ncbi:Cupredoxin [Geopyxis carbonaria]|nr:Cupredoxin [Geopyxis carbonaria]